MGQTIIFGPPTCALAIKLTSKAEFIPGLDLPDIPIISDIPNVIDDGLDIVGSGLEDFGDIMLDGIDITLEGLDEIGTFYYDGLSDIGELTLEGLDEMGEGLIDIGEITYEGFDIGTEYLAGAAYYAGSDIGSFFEDDLGDFIVDDIGGGLEDTWNWVSDGENWEAAGKTLGAGSVLIL